MRKEKINSLKKIIKILNHENYKIIQYFPYSFSYLAIAKELENIVNFFLRKKHLLFYFSLFPSFYLLFLNRRIKILNKILLLNKLFDLKEVNKFFKKKDIKTFIKIGIIKKIKKKYQFNLSFIPYKNFIFIRDPHHIYEKWLDKKKSINKIWMGADSIIFLRFLNKYLKTNNFDKVLEIGSGSGIVINSISDKFNKCEAIDINKRAVEFTLINSKINNIKNLKVYKSNLYKRVKGRFDLIIANPWFVDLKKQGLEEAPGIVRYLDKYLLNSGKCLMIMNSYINIKKRSDTLEDFFSNLLKKKNFDINLYSNGYFYEFNRHKEYKKYNIDYAASYNVEIIINGSGMLKKFEAPFLRRMRDFFFLKILSLLKKMRTF